MACAEQSHLVLGGSLVAPAQQPRRRTLQATCARHIQEAKPNRSGACATRTGLPSEILGKVSDLFLTPIAPSNEPSVRNRFVGMKDPNQPRRLSMLDRIRRCPSGLRMPLAYDWRIQI